MGTFVPFLCLPTCILRLEPSNLGLHIWNEGDNTCWEVELESVSELSDGGEEMVDAGGLLQ